jgi:hypothetical protein
MLGRPAAQLVIIYSECYLGPGRIAIVIFIFHWEEGPKGKFSLLIDFENLEGAYFHYKYVLQFSFVDCKFLWPFI